MSDAEARIVLEIMSTVHGECYICSGELFRAFICNWPRFEHIADEVWDHATDWRNTA